MKLTTGPSTTLQPSCMVVSVILGRHVTPLAPHERDATSDLGQCTHPSRRGAKPIYSPPLGICCCLNQVESSSSVFFLTHRAGPSFRFLIFIPCVCLRFLQSFPTGIFRPVLFRSFPFSRRFCWSNFSVFNVLRICLFAWLVAWCWPCVLRGRWRLARTEPPCFLGRRARSRSTPLGTLEPLSAHPWCRGYISD